MLPSNVAAAPMGNIRTEGVGRGSEFDVLVDGIKTVAYDGESVLAVLWAAGVRSLRVTARTGQPRGFFCGMGVCFDCLVTVDGRHSVRACMEPARPGMSIQRQQDARAPSIGSDNA